MTYKTRRTLAGLPLIHVATGQVVDGRYRRGIARGWIAVGDVSFGVLLSIGGAAFGGVALGGLGVGVLSIGGLALFSFLETCLPTRLVARHRARLRRLG